MITINTTQVQFKQEILLEMKVVKFLAFKKYEYHTCYTISLAIKEHWATTQGLLNKLQAKQIVQEQKHGPRIIYVLTEQGLTISKLQLQSLRKELAKILSN